MKLLIISGTPKTDGICHSFVTTAQETAKELNVNAEVIQLSGVNLNKCKMCGDGWGICFSEHYCAFGDKDGFNGLQKKVSEANAFVYITPVYWGEVSEELKIFIDKLRRCQATKQWDEREDEISFHKGKPSIIVASAGGGGGGIVSTFAALEMAILHMGGDAWPRESSGIFDFIGVNRWNQVYKRDALKSAITEMVRYWKRPKLVSVEPKPDYQLLLTYDNNEQRIFDVEPHLDTPPYNELKDEALFNKVKITGFKIEWRPLLDMEPDTLYFDSVPVKT
jgi:multimeric flavodoxin WrbA